MNSKQALINYLGWMKKFNPLLYNAVKISHPAIWQSLQEKGLGATTDTASMQVHEPWYAQILNTVADAAKAFVPIYQQKKILQTQLDLAKAGQPMLTNDQIRQAGTVNMQIDLPPEIKDEVIQTTQATRTGINWGTMLMIGVGGFFLFTMMNKKDGRRR